MVLHEHLGHCGECHTACNLLGARHAARELAGNKNGPNGKKVANITPHPKDGLGGWRAGDITYYLKTGFLPDGDPALAGPCPGSSRTPPLTAATPVGRPSRPTCRAIRRSRDSDPERPRSIMNTRIRIIL